MPERVYIPQRKVVPCPYCGTDNTVECWDPNDHEVLWQCYAGICLRSFVVRFVVFIDVQLVKLYGEEERQFERDDAGNRREKFDELESTDTGGDGDDGVPDPEAEQVATG